MKKILKFLLVCEGPTDIVLLKSLSEKISSLTEGYTIEINELSPQVDATSGNYPRHGWSGVKQWCEAHRQNKTEAEIQRIDERLRPLLLRKKWKTLLSMSGANGLIIQIDTDIASELNIPGLTFNGQDDTRRDHCHKAILHWLGESEPLSDNLYFLLPSYAIETWLLATHQEHDVFPDGNIIHFEHIDNFEDRLIRLGYDTQTKNGRIRLKKEKNTYKLHGETIFNQRELVKSRCAEAHKFISYLESKMT